MEALRSAGHDVVAVGAVARGSSDRMVLQLAVRENRLLLTFDKDFGELAFRDLHATAGVILLRISARSPSAVADMVVRAIGRRDDWGGHFSIIDDTQTRMTALPKSG